MDANYTVQLLQVNSLHREGIRIYTEDFKTSAIESLHIEANKLFLDMRRNELGLRFLFKLRRNPTYTELLVTLDNSEDYNFKEKEKATRPTGMHFRILE